MITENEKSPLTRNASGQENGTEIEARGLSSAVNGTQTENLTSRKSPAPEQASEATAARPSMEDSTAEGIVDARRHGGNETSSKVSRADALTADEREVLEHTAGFLHTTAATALRKLLAAAPVEQSAAAPIDEPDVNQLLEAAALGLERAGMLDSMRIVRGMKPGYPKTAPAPAGERAAFEWPRLPLLPEAVITTADGEAVFTAHQMQGYANAYGEMVRARAASANETGAEGVRAWETDDGRVISDAQKQQALRDGGASASSVRPYAHALCRTAPAQAAEPAIYQILTEEGAWLDTTPEYYERVKSDPALARVVYTAPQHPSHFAILTREEIGEAWREAGSAGVEKAIRNATAQADAWEGLTDELLMRCRELLELNERGESPQVALRALADTYHPDISAHDRRSMATSQTQIEAMRALLAAHPGQPAPRDAITRSKRILGLVDSYRENPTQHTRTALRVALMDEFQPEPRAEVAYDAIAKVAGVLRSHAIYLSRSTLRDVIDAARAGDAS
ncbi:hypothetical protein KPB04_28060 [Burkholderia cenocepacia]|nr:hypothetical protein [Burkholderia cenocepacia]